MDMDVEKTDIKIDADAEKTTDIKMDTDAEKTTDTKMDTDAGKTTDQVLPEVPAENTDEKVDSATDEKRDQLAETSDENTDLLAKTSDENTDMKMDIATTNKTKELVEIQDEYSDELVEVPDKNSDVQKDTLVNEKTGQDQPDKDTDENTVPGHAQPDKITNENTESNLLDKTSDENTVPVQDESDKTTTNENAGPDQSDKSTDKSTVSSPDQPDKTIDEIAVKMDVDAEVVNIDEAKVTRKRSIESDSEGKEDAVPSKKHAGLTPLCFEEDYDSTAETVVMTFDEAKDFLIKKVTECINSPVNPLYALQQRAEDLKVELAAKVAEYKKLCQGYHKLHENQEKFLRHAGLLPKVPMTSVSVSVDLPVLASSIPRNVNLPRAVQQSVLNNKELSITRLENRTTSSSSASTLSKAVAKKSSEIECIDLTDDADNVPTHNMRSPNVLLTVLKHPAPLPPRPVTRSNQPFPPKPSLKISSEEKGIILQWDFPRTSRQLPAPISRFEIFGYQEMKNSAINTLLWKKIGNVDAMSLPMACTLTQFADGSRYHFTIRAVDVKGEHSHYSDVASITYSRKPPAPK